MIEIPDYKCLKIFVVNPDYNFNKKIYLAYAEIVEYIKTDKILNLPHIKNINDKRIWKYYLREFIFYKYI